MITKRPFGRTADGREVNEFVLDNGVICVHVLDYGCTVKNVFVTDKNGEKRDVVLGYDDIAGYETHDGYLGAFIGRVANRIGGAKFTLNGKNYELFKNDGNNSLHGGEIGFDKKVFESEIVGEKLYFRYVSKDGEEGYPGNMKVEVCYYLDKGAFELCYFAECDKDTPVSLTNHSYFNLSATNTVLDHELTVDSNNITAIDKTLIPTGELTCVENSPFDFRKAQKIGLYIDYPHKQLEYAGGYDHNFVLKNYGKFEKVATLYAQDTGINMDVYTDNFGMQVYSGNFLGGSVGKGGRLHERRSAVCLETQNFPDAINKPAFPSCVLKAGDKFYKRTAYSFSVKK